MNIIKEFLITFSKGGYINGSIYYNFLNIRTLNLDYCIKLKNKKGDVKWLQIKDLSKLN